MSETTKEKIIQINTTGAQKNVKTLKQQIKELRDQLGTLEKGTAEYDAVAKKLADTNQKQIQVNEAMKYSNQDIGATFTNLTRVATGVVGAINGVNAVMQMMGADSEEAAEAMKKIQLSMALVQGMNAVVEAGKSLHGLAVAFGLAGNSAKTLEKSEIELNTTTTLTTGALNKETAALNANSVAKTANAAGAAKTVKTVKAVPNLLKLITTGVKTLGTALKSTLGIIGLVVAGITALVMVIKNHNEKMKEANAEAERWRNINNEINTTIQQENVHIDTLVSGLNNQNKSLTERKAIADELNRTIPEMNAHWDEEGKTFVYNEKVLQKYNNAKAENIRLTELEKRAAEQQAVVEEKKAAYEEAALKGRKRKIKQTLEDYEAEQIKLHELRLEIEKINLAVASDTKSTTTTRGGGGGGMRKTVKELAEEFKKLWAEYMQDLFSWSTYKATFNGFYSEADIALKKIKNLIKVNGLDVKGLSEEFVKQLEDDLTNLKPYDISLDFIFGKDSVKKLEEELIKEEAKLTKYTKNEIKVTEKALNAQKQKVTDLRNQINVYNELAEAVVKYLKVYQDEKKYGEVNTKKKTEALEREKDLYLSYQMDLRSHNPWAELNHTLDQTTYELDEIEKELIQIKEEEEKLGYIGYTDDELKRIKEIKQQLEGMTMTDALSNPKQWRELNDELAKLQNNRVYNKEVNERLNEIAARREELEKNQTELERTLEETNYQIRLKHIDDEYAKRKEAEEKNIQKLKNDRSMYGGGTMDYNADLTILKVQLNTIQEQKKAVERYYNDLMDTVTNGDEEWVRLEIEKQAALTQLEEEGADKRAEIAQAEFERKIKIQQTYVNALSSITSQINSLISERMSAYDSNSKQYKKLAITQAVIDTLSGTLSAFMSGFQSGIPWPGNLALATLLGGLAFTTGTKSIENIRNESLQNTTTTAAATGNFGDYDTLSYMNDVNLLDSIQDQRVYVTENDITSTQNRVQVRESEATF